MSFQLKKLLYVLINHIVTLFTYNKQRGINGLLFNNESTIIYNSVNNISVQL